MNRNRLLDKLENKINASVGHRADLQFSDARRINQNTAHFMLAYSGDNPPNSNDIGEFFGRKFDYKLTPFFSTARIYEDRKVVTVVAQILSVTREVQDIKRRNMVPVIQGAVYLDVPLQETWQVEEREGEKVLVRKVKDDIMALVQARKKSMLDSTATAHKTFASVVQGDNLMKYLALLEKGDQVRIMDGDKVVDAEVMAVTDAEVKVKMKSGMKTLPRQSVVDVVAKSPEKEAERMQRNEQYFADAFGDPNYAEKLVAPRK